jgi:sugar phosphate isomerase/epimerase
VGSDRLKVVWDPANAFVSGEDSAFPDGYEAVKPYMAHVHIKDARLLDPESGLTAWERIGDGVVDYRGQLKALIDDGYTDIISVETHYSPPGKTPAEATRLTAEGLRQVLDSL